MRRLAVFAVGALLFLTFALAACANPAPCLRGHNDYTTQFHCASYRANGTCSFEVPYQQSYWVCDQYGTPYPTPTPDGRPS